MPRRINPMRLFSRAGNKQPMMIHRNIEPTRPDPSLTESTKHDERDLEQLALDLEGDYLEPAGGTFVVTVDGEPVTEPIPHAATVDEIIKATEVGVNADETSTPSLP